MWGTEEDLFRLHAIVQGERNERDASGRVIVHFDQKITLGIQEYSIPKYFYLEPDIILRNKGNIHWTSLITDHQLNLSKQLPAHLSTTTASLSSTSIITDKSSTGKDGTFAEKLQECEKLIESLRYKVEDTERVIINEIASKLDAADDDSLEVIFNLLKQFSVGRIPKSDSTDSDRFDRIIESNTLELKLFQRKYKFSDNSEVYINLQALVGNLNLAIEDYKKSNRDGHAKKILLDRYSSIFSTEIAKIRKLPEIINEPWIKVAVKKLLQVFCDILSVFSPYFKGSAFTKSTQVDHFKSKIDDIKDKLPEVGVEEELEDEEAEELDAFEDESEEDDLASRPPT